ncbi:MAG TPA: VanZ family protein, partial [Propionibacteriaceae bacterium]|nr:VanZ family protein [Propionibacteriaceae bacterium]
MSKNQGQAPAGLSLVPATTLGRGGLGPIEWRSYLLQPGLSLASPEAKLNVLLFAPAVFFGVLASRGLMATLMAAMVFSVLVELAQSLTGLGVCQTSDVVRNFSGAMV